MSNLFNFFFSIAVFLFFNITSLGQNNNLRIYTPPNESFKKLKLETYNGLLRLGYIDTQQYIDNKEMQLNYSILKRLLSLEQRVNSYEPSVATYDWDKQQNIMQMHPALELSGFIERKVASQYFKDVTKHGEGLYRFDFVGDNEFDKKRSREKFVGNFLKDLALWPGIIAENGLKDAYYVTQDLVLDYDFENGGISLFLGFCNIEDNNSFKEKATRLTRNNNLSTYDLRAKKTYLKNAFFTQEDMGRMPYLNYKAQNLYENNVDRENMVVFFPIEEEKANELLKNRRVFIVRKIRLFDDFTFYIASSTIELYCNKELTDKVGELDYNDLTFY